MRVLWLCNIILPKIANDLNIGFSNSGGWLVGLADDLIENDSIDLTITFPMNHCNELVEGNIEGINYVGFPQQVLDPSSYNSKLEIYFKQIINNIKPDIIHIFGTEYPHTLAMMKSCRELDMLDKTVINIQGLCSIYSNHYYAHLPHKVINGYTFRDFLKRDNIVKQRNKFKIRGNYETESLLLAKNVIGRTSWDKACTIQINPNLNYFKCNETLRSSFYNYQWDFRTIQKYSIFVSQATYPIKGFHLLLEALPKIIEKYPEVKVYVAGENILDTNSFKDKIKLSSYSKYLIKLIEQYNLRDYVRFLGNLTEDQMCQQYLKSHLFISPSVIENSPNSVGEAMLLGLPVISSDVGGVIDMLEHKKEGFIYPSDAPYMLAHYVDEIFSSDDLAQEISYLARERAAVTHSRKLNLNSILEIYNSLVGN